MKEFSSGYFPDIFLRCSYVPPSLVHRYSIETMDHRWSIDGVSMEYLRWNSEGFGSLNVGNDDRLTFALFA